jgi:hypothetical protein
MHNVVLNVYWAVEQMWLRMERKWNQGFRENIAAEVWKM